MSMSNEKPELMRIGNEALFALARELFAEGKKIKFVVAGSSMYPFIRHDRDMVTLAGAGFSEIRVSDIVLAYRENQRKYILHRVVKKTRQAFYMTGDAQTALDGPYSESALIGVVTEIHRVGKDGGETRISGPVYKSLARLWLLARPFRPVIMRAYFFVRRKTRR